MKLILDIANDKFNENDILAFKHGKWKGTKKEALLGELIEAQNKKNLQYEQEIAQLKEDLVKLAKVVKEK